MLCYDAVRGGGAKREQWCLLHSLQDCSHSLSYPQSNLAPQVLIPKWLGCAHSRPLWVSPPNSLVRLGISPADSSTPMGVFNQRFEALFPCTGALRSASLPAVCPVYLCTNVGPWGATCRFACPVLHHSESGPLSLSVRECVAAGSASGQTACPVRPTLCQSGSRHGNVSLLRPGACLCPSY